MSSTLFTSDWWLDAVTNGNWGEVASEPIDGQPFNLRFRVSKRSGLRVLSNPPLTPYLQPPGVVGTRSSTQINVYNERVQELLAALPKHELLRLNLDVGPVNLLPWLWSGCSMTVATTFRIDLTMPEEERWSRLAESTKRKIRTARRDCTFRDDVTPDQLLSLAAETMASKGRSTGFPSDALLRSAMAAIDHESGRVFGVERGGTLVAACFIVWDTSCAYYLVGGRDPSDKGGARHLLMWNAMTACSTLVDSFDFEGSSDPGVAQFFRSLGGGIENVVGVSRMSGRLGPLGRARRHPVARLVLGP